MPAREQGGRRAEGAEELGATVAHAPERGGDEGVTGRPDRGLELGHDLGHRAPAGGGGLRRGGERPLDERDQLLEREPGVLRPQRQQVLLVARVEDRGDERAGRGQRQPERQHCDREDVQAAGAARRGSAERHVTGSARATGGNLRAWRWSSHGKRRSVLLRAPLRRRRSSATWASVPSRSRPVGVAALPPDQPGAAGARASPTFCGRAAGYATSVGERSRRRAASQRDRSWGEMWPRSA